MTKEAVKPLKQPWSQAQINDWFEGVLSQGKRRDYGAVMSRLTRLPANTNVVEQYGLVRAGGDQYPLLCVTVGDLKNGKPNILITGGVHGYEPSGVESSIRFLEEDAQGLSKKFNFVVYPCLSPWSYEYDQRWNANALDPNREFSKEHNIEETHAFMTSMKNRGVFFAVADDQHETSDRDIELRQMRADRFGLELSADYRSIPQGYSLNLTDFGDPVENAKQMLFGRRIIEAVSAISPIAPERKIMKVENRDGILLLPAASGLLRTYLQNFASRVAVTEVYPDHPTMTPEKCVEAQLASLHASLHYVIIDYKIQQSLNIV